MSIGERVRFYWPDTRERDWGYLQSLPNQGKVWIVTRRNGVQQFDAADVASL